MPEVRDGDEKKMKFALQSAVVLKMLDEPFLMEIVLPFVTLAEELPELPDARPVCMLPGWPPIELPPKVT